jgi:hypothetical protein
MSVGLAAMYGSFMLLRFIGLSVIDQPRIIATLELGIYGVVGLIVYLLTTSYFHIPQTIFHLKEGNIFTYLKNRFFKNPQDI